MRNNGTHLPPIFLHMVPSLKDKPPYFDLHLTDAQWLPDVDPGHWDSSQDLYERGNYENRYDIEAIREESNSPGPVVKSSAIAPKIIYPENEVILEPRSEMFYKSDSVDLILSKKMMEKKEIDKKEGNNVEGHKNNYDDMEIMKAKYVELEKQNATLLLRIDCLNDIVANMVGSTASIASVTSSVHDTTTSSKENPNPSINVSTMNESKSNDNINDIDIDNTAAPISYSMNTVSIPLKNKNEKVVHSVDLVSGYDKSMTIVTSTSTTTIEQRKEEEEGSEIQKEGLKEEMEKISSTLTQAVFRRLKSIKSLLDNTAIKTLLEGSPDGFEGVIEKPLSSSLSPSVSSSVSSSVSPSTRTNQPFDADRDTKINDSDKDCDKDALEVISFYIL